MRPGRASAPVPLDLVQDFLNTCDKSTGADELATVEALSEWHSRRGLICGEVALRKTDLDRALVVRAGLRALAHEHGGVTDDPAKVEALDAITASVPLRLAFAGEAGLLPAASEPADAALGRLLAIVAQARSKQWWDRLKACHEAGCQRIYYDRSKNRSGRWCAMALCGASNKQRASLQRRRAKRAAPAEPSAQKQAAAH